MCRRIVGKERLRGSLINARDLAELAVTYFVTETQTVHGLNGGNAGGGLHLVAGFQFVQQRLFRGIVPRGDQQRDEVAAAKGLVDLHLCHFMLCQMACRYGLHCVGIIDPPAGIVTANHQQHQQNRHNMARCVGKFADNADLRDKALMLGLIHRLPKEHQQRGHEQEHGEQADGHGLDQVEAQIRPQTELHKGHGGQTGDRGQTAGKNLRDRGGQRFFHRFPDAERFVLFFIAIAEDNRIVHGERQLHDDRDGVGDKGNCPHQERGAHVDDRRS